MPRRFPGRSWELLEEASVPVAQDFHALFGVGTDDVSISTIDPAGIALAAIQELHKRTQRIDKLESQIAELREMMEVLMADK